MVKPGVRIDARPAGDRVPVRAAHVRKLHFEGGLCVVSRFRGDRVYRDGRRGQQSLAQQRVLQAGAEAAPSAVEQVVDRDRQSAVIADPHLQVILQILADPGQVRDRPDAGVPKDFRVSDSR